MKTRWTGGAAWPATLALLMLGAAAPALAQPPPASPDTVYQYHEEVYQGPASGITGYVIIGGNQAIILHPIAGMPLESRYLDLRRRLLGVLQPSGSAAVQVAPGDVTVGYQGLSPVIYLKGMPIITVTNEDAAQARTDPQLLANQWADSLRQSVANYRASGNLPADFVTMRLVPGNYPGTALPNSVANDTIQGSAGQVTYTVQNGVVTLNGTVASNFERAMAELQVRRIPGVVRVVNNLVVKTPQPQPAPQTPVADTELRREVGQQLLTIIRMNSPVPTPNGP